MEYAARLGGHSDLPEVMWTGVELYDAPGQFIFFWQFTPGWDEMRRRMPDLDPTAPELAQHANTALGLRTPWVAVWDVDRTAEDFSALGVEGGDKFEVLHLKATGREVHLSQGKMLLVEPTRDASPAMDHLLVRGEDLMGISIEVGDLEKARQLIQRSLGRPLEVYDGLEGPSFLVPADLAHGVYLEFFQPESATSIGEQ